MGIFKPEIGDTVGFWNDKDELWETGEVIAYGADRRLYFIQPNDEDMLECLVNYTNIRPVSEQKTTGRMSALEFELDYWKNRAEVTHLQHLAANKRADDAETELAELQAQIDAFPYETGAPVGDKVAARIAEYRERTHSAESRVEELEANLAKFQGVLVPQRDLDEMTEARDYWKNRAEITHLQHVAANKRADKLVRQLADTVERAEKAEADLHNAQMSRDGWAAAALKIEQRETDAEARIEELEDQNRILKADLTELREKYRKDADPDLVRSQERKIANIRAELDSARSKADNFEFKWRMTAEGKAATREGSMKEVLAEMTRTAAEDGTGDQVDEFPESTRVPQAVRDNDDDRWELNHDTGMYECGRYSYALTDIDTVFGIKERIY